MHLWQARYVAQQHILKARQCCSGHGDGVSVTTHSLGDPQDVYLLHPGSIASSLSLRHEPFLHSPCALRPAVLEQYALHKSPNKWTSTPVTGLFTRVSSLPSALTAHPSPQ